ncbi:Similar to Myb-related protein A; acc. no. P10243 [Pyronema omphalodes CBS 100304]|uniref:Similar to Myb-related protein A acc. no. P10243 n=1 Tax=Pyronema omphalodes (strain CBS 100304) TaxID=1076935 RepID=U4KUX4_PYROM|nr:Similar to Myb-related protein A; acc. no. P10243 [Pyronema omphalodes CBS 100304]
MSKPTYSRVTSRKLRHAKLMEPVRNCPWRPEEEKRLSEAVARLGESCDWNLVAQSVMTRDSRECKDRWFKLASPSGGEVSHSSTLEEYNNNFDISSTSTSGSGSSGGYLDDSDPNSFLEYLNQPEFDGAFDNDIDLMSMYMTECTGASAK